MIKPPLVSVVVVTRDRRRDLEECLRSYLHSDYKNIEIIAVDNNSSPKLRTWLPKKYPSVKLITLDENKGAAEGRNIGFSYSSGDFILFSDDDAYADKSMVKNLVDAFNKRKEAGIIQPLVYDKQEKDRLQGAGHDINLLTGRIKAWGVKEKDVGQYDGIRQIPLCGCVWMVKKEVFVKIGGYDEDYFIPYEDSDFSYRARCAGYKLYCCSDAKTWHQGPKATFVHPWIEWLGITSPQRAYRVARNKILFICKNSRWSEKLFFLFIMLPVYVFLHSLIILLTMRIDILLMYWKGVGSGLWNFFSFDTYEKYISPVVMRPYINRVYKPRKYPLVSIVIPVKNSLSYMEKFVDSIYKLDYPELEVIIVDDSSTDETEMYTKKRFKNIFRGEMVYIRNRKIVGIAQSRNVGINKARGKYVAFAEVDMAFSKDWLTKMVSFLELNTGRNIIGATPKIMDYFKRELINSAGTLIIPQTGWVIPVNVGMKSADIIDEVYPSIITGVGSVVRKDVLTKIYGFDAKLFRNVEDIDLGWRVWLAGYCTFYYPFSKVFHYTSKDMKTRTDISVFQQQFHLTKNLRLIYKNYEIKNMLKYLLTTVLINFVRIFSNLYRKDPYSSAGIIYGTLWFVKNIFNNHDERKKVMSYRKVSDKYIRKYIMTPGSFYEIYNNQLLKILEISRRFSMKRI